MSISRRDLLKAAAVTVAASQIPMVAMAKPVVAKRAVRHDLNFDGDLSFRSGEFTDLVLTRLGQKVCLKTNPNIPLIVTGIRYTNPPSIEPHPDDLITVKLDLDDLLTTPMGPWNTERSFTTGTIVIPGDPRLVILAGRTLGIENEVRHLMDEPWHQWKYTTTSEGWRIDRETEHVYVGRRAVFNHLAIPLTVGIVHYTPGDNPPWLTFWFELGRYENLPPDDRGRSHAGSADLHVAEHAGYPEARVEKMPAKLWPTRTIITHPEKAIVKAIEQLRCLPWRYTGLPDDEITALLATGEGKHRLACMGRRGA